MNKRFLLAIALVGLTLGVLYGSLEDIDKPKSFSIGLLIPMEHAALTDIVEGFKTVVSKHYPKAVTFDVQSAQNDIKLQRSIVDRFVGQKVDLIVPVGTSATQMTLSIAKDQPIVSLAALYSEAERQKLNPKNMTAILDEIGAQKKLDFITYLLPNIKHLTLFLHSGNEKDFKEVGDITEMGKTLGISVQTIMVQNLLDMETAAKAIPEESEAILILKDHLIASGVPLLAPMAKEKGIPLMTSDEGSVKSGATLGLGVEERKIGEQGGALAIKVLDGNPIADLPVQEMKELTVFYNLEACQKLGIDLARLQAYTNKNHYRLLKSR